MSNQNNRFRLDELLQHYNLNKPAGKPALNRTKFGRLVFPDRTDESVSVTLSHWSNISRPSVPSFQCCCKIAEVLDMKMEEIKKFMPDGK